MYVCLLMAEYLDKRHYWGLWGAVIAPNPPTPFRLSLWSTKNSSGKELHLKSGKQKTFAILPLELQQISEGVKVTSVGGEGGGRRRLVAASLQQIISESWKQKWQHISSCWFPWCQTGDPCWKPARPNLNLAFSARITTPLTLTSDNTTLPLRSLHCWELVRKIRDDALPVALENTIFASNGNFMTLEDSIVSATLRW